MDLSTAQLETLRRTALFQTIPETVIRRVTASPDCTVKTYEKGCLVYGRHDFSRSLGIVFSGRLRVEKGNAVGREMIMSTLTCGSLFGAAALFNDEPEYATEITALENTEIMFLAQRLVRRMMQTEPRIAENYIRYLSGRILFLNRKIYFLTAGTAEQRLSGFLADNLTPDVPSVLPLPMSKLACALNVSRASLYRAFDSLIAAGAIEKSGRSVCIINAERLRLTEADPLPVFTD